MSTIVTAADAASFLSVVPRLLGYVPTRSLVLVPLSAGRSLGGMRLDLPPEDDAGAVEQVTSTAIGLLCRLPDVDALVAVAYTDATCTAGLPGEAYMTQLARVADACGLRICDALVVAADGWGGWHGARAGQVHALSEVVVQGVMGDQSAGAALPSTSRGSRESVAQAWASLDAALHVVCSVASLPHAVERIDPAALEAACALDDLPDLFERALAWPVDDLAPMQAATLGWCLARPSLRDIALVQWAASRTAGEHAFEAQQRWEDGEEYPIDIACIMWGEGPRPDPERLQHALDLTRHVAALLPKRRRSGPLAVCGWLSWALGRSSHADAYVRQALAHDPEHGLAQIVSSLVSAGHLPDWAFDRGV